MSLAPGEQRALTEIEGWLRRSDPELALTLERFGRRSATRNVPQRWLQAVPPRTRRQRLALLAAVVLVLSVLWTAVFSRPRQPTPARLCGTAVIRLVRCQAPAVPYRQRQLPASHARPAGHR